MTIVELKAEGVHYYSRQDKDSFFCRIKALPEVRDMHGLAAAFTLNVAAH